MGGLPGAPWVGPNVAEREMNSGLRASGIASRAMAHVEHLSVEIGPRPLGSTANQAAADHIHSVFVTCGLDVGMQDFACPRWEDDIAALCIEGRTLTAVANTWSPPCDVVGQGVPLGTLAELESAALLGRIGILYGDLTASGGLAARSADYFPDRHRRILELLESKKPAALVCIYPRQGYAGRVIRDWESPIASATVAPEDGRLLLAHPQQLLHLTIAAKRSPDHFRNIIGRAPGQDMGRILLMAHFDSTAGSPGAIDNGSGVAALLTSAEVLAGEDLPLAVEWAALNGEENGGIGDTEYHLRRKGQLGSFLAAINMDGAGQLVGANSVAAMGCSIALRERIQELCTSYRSVVWADPWYESNHSGFLRRGVPCISLTSVGVKNVHHRPTDTLEWIGPHKLDEVVSLLVEIVGTLQGKTGEWCRL